MRKEVVPLKKTTSVLILALGIALPILAADATATKATPTADSKTPPAMCHQTTTGNTGCMGMQNHSQMQMQSCCHMK